MNNPPVVAPCLACQGRCCAWDVVEDEDGNRHLHRTVCPMCAGRGVLDYANLAAKKDTE